MIYFVGAGSGDAELITVKGKRLLEEASLVVYAGSLVNPALLEYCRPDCERVDSARLTLEEIISLLCARGEDETVVRLHTGDPSLYGAIAEQMRLLDERGRAYQIVPGVSSMSAAAAALKAEFTPPGVSQSVIISRRAGRTAVPEKESIPSLAAHGASMVLFLSAGMLKDLCRELMEGGYPPDTPAAVVYKASWPDEEIVRGSLCDISEKAQHITKTALVLVGDFLKGGAERSRLYDPGFSHGYREAGK